MTTIIDSTKLTKSPRYSGNLLEGYVASECKIDRSCFGLSYDVNNPCLVNVCEYFVFEQVTATYLCKYDDMVKK